MKRQMLPSFRLHRVLQHLAGLSARALIALCLIALLGFAFIFFALSTWGAPGNGIAGLSEIPGLWLRFANAMYFSAVNATTLGYGDLTPSGVSKIFAVTEAAFGFFAFAVLVSKLVSEKQEIALYNVHKLAFQNAFFKTHEGFFLIRRDCDGVEASLREHKSMHEKAWRNLAIACQKGQTLIEGVLDFYDDFDWYDIDPRREHLLLESFHRTLIRFSSLLNVLRKARVQWKAHADIAFEIREFLGISGKVVAKWKKRASKRNREWFGKIEGELALLEKAAG